MALRLFPIHSLLCSVALSGLSTVMPLSAATAQTVKYNIPPQPLDRALREFGVQSGTSILVDAALTAGKSTNGFVASGDSETALTAILRNTGLGFQRKDNVFVVKPALATSQAEAPPEPTADATQEIIVTARKREERIQDVPIAISAFSPKALDQLKIEGGSELLRAIPNVTFSKNNFSGFNFAIRGIGTKAVSVTTDPAVAVSYNNAPLIRNRLFEQEYLDVERVEVLRGPQGTLYGRNATAGVVNQITAKPSFAKFDGELRGEVGNYDTRRLRGFVNIPITDTIAVRVAGATTRRNGFDYNTITDRAVNGRDLWQARGSLRWKPTDRFTADFIWEHFQENDNRSRTGKQLCTRDPGPSSIGGIAITDPQTRGILSQGCQNKSIFTDAAYGTPNGLSLPLVIAAGTLANLGYDANFNLVSLLTPGVDPYGGLPQSKNLREIASQFDPVFRAKNDVYQLNLQYDFDSGLKLFSQTMYSKDTYYSAQDYNRFNTVPIFNNSSDLMFDPSFQPVTGGGLSPGGVFTDPQLGPSNRLLGVDLNRATSEQFSQEFRLQSSFAGPFNFSVGANYLHYQTKEDYFVFFNIASAINQTLFTDCRPGVPQTNCPYIDPNPLASVAGDGHNYFRSANPYKVDSKGLFGEVYYQLSPTVKLTGGLRYTDDRKTTTPVPSQLLLATGVVGSGFVDRGYPESADIRQHFRAVTGKIGIDWKPELSFTNQSLVYASYSRGYKAGGGNPPPIGADPASLQFVVQPQTFEPEFVNAFEVGMKNTLAGGKLTLNITGFLYDYDNYQVSKIIDRTALNENIKAKTWGLELESLWAPSRSFSMNLNLGYLGSRIGKGSKSIDVMDRTQGNADWTVVKPFLQLASNCVAPTKFVTKILSTNLPFNQAALTALCGGSYIGDFIPGVGATGVDFTQFYGFSYNPATDGPNQGQGFTADLSGKQLPNAPHFTASIGAQYTVFLNDWEATFHADYYRQSASYARVYNTAFDRLKAWDNANLSLTVARPDSGLSFQLYVKNVFNKSPITDSFVNSDDSGLTTNVFTLDRRIIGFNVTKRF
ncbi:TonB-dependent receptor [Sphingomonas sp. GB1N7]|uniref:TonB-dependent receptor n=1 Tax=Parasphingomonas caseinilytica TaxID=3096158 RepID=UPI002FC9C455